MKNYQRGYSSKKKLSGRGELQHIETDGPHVEWLGMPESYKHTLTIDGEKYIYYCNDQNIGIELGKIVVFRYLKSPKGLYIDKKSLGVYIDPATYMQDQNK